MKAKKNTILYKEGFYICITSLLRKNDHFITMISWDRGTSSLLARVFDKKPRPKIRLSLHKLDCS